MSKKARNRQIIGLRDRGLSFAEIAKEMRITKGVVAGVCLRAGKCDPFAPKLQPTDHLRIFELRKSGLSAVEVAKKYGVTVNHVQGIYNRHCDAIERDNQDLAICEMIDGGHNSHAISLALGVHRNQITRMRNALEKIT